MFSVLKIHLTVDGVLDPADVRWNSGVHVWESDGTGTSPGDDAHLSPVAVQHQGTTGVTVASTLSGLGEGANLGGEDGVRKLTSCAVGVRDGQQVDELERVGNGTSGGSPSPSAEDHRNSTADRSGAERDGTDQGVVGYGACGPHYGDVVGDGAGIVSGVGDDPVKDVPYTSAVDGVGSNVDAQRGS